MKKQSLRYHINSANPLRVIAGVVVGLVIFAVLFFAAKQNLDNRSKAWYYRRTLTGSCSTLSCPANQKKTSVRALRSTGGPEQSEKICMCVGL